MATTIDELSKQSSKPSKVYIFVYNVVAIKADFSQIKKACPEARLVLLGSNYCLRNISSKNRHCFDDVHQLKRDFHDVDYDQIAPIINNYVAEYGAANIRLLTNEDSTQIALARLRELHSIDGAHVEQILPFVDKVVSKRQLNNIVRTPKFVAFDKSAYANNKPEYLDEIITKLGFPMFVKPVDLVSSIETHRIDDLSQLKVIAEHILNHQYQFEIDEFIDGELFHCDTLIINGSIQFFIACQYINKLANFSKGFPMGSMPLENNNLLKRLRIFNEKVLTKLDAKNGAYHLEVFLQDNTQELIFLEIAARTPGAGVPSIYQIMFKINVEELHYLIHIAKIDSINSNSPNKFAGWVTFPKISGTITAIEAPLLDIEYTFNRFVDIGDNITKAESLLDSSCSTIFWDNSLKKVQLAFEFLKKFQPITTIPVSNLVKNVNIKSIMNIEDHFQIIEKLFNAAPFVFWKGIDGTYLGCNENQAKTFNLTSSKFIGKTIYELLDDQESAKLIDETDNYIMENDLIRIVEEPLSTPQGQKVYLSQKQCLHDHEGNVIGLLGFSMDITELKAQQQITEEANRKLITDKLQAEANYYKKIAKNNKNFKTFVETINTALSVYKTSQIKNDLDEEIDIDPRIKNLRLSPREQDILYYLSQGYTPKSIAQAISKRENKVVAHSTIQAIIDKRLYTKLETNNVSSLLEKAYLHGLVPFFAPNTDKVKSIEQNE